MLSVAAASNAPWPGSCPAAARSNQQIPEDAEEGDEPDPARRVDPERGRVADEPVKQADGHRVGKDSQGRGKEVGEQIDETTLSRGTPVEIRDMGKLIQRIVVAPGSNDEFIDQIRAACAQQRREPSSIR